ncbi:hypothetical protein CFAM422_006562 [Trichoderma lentiforme]|uniref:Uncharacterized protein n=1 Tax=Trichoderma lentiforme TaxID=1567552 RepID=A0A9P5CE65_9HYPO|nr:hypothetical protein CFAM422_006562 [Trichoderma lentiforme]
MTISSYTAIIGLESWVNATELGVPLYQHAGFKAVHRINPRPVMPPQLRDSGSEVEVDAKAEADRAEWRRCYEMCTSDEDVVTMFRPVRAA